MSKYWKHEFIWGAYEWSENAPKGVSETVTMDAYIKVGGHFSPVDLYWGQTLTVLWWFEATLLAMVPIDFPVANAFFTFSVEAELTLEMVTVYPIALLLITKSALQTSSESAVVSEEYFWPLLLLFSWSPLILVLRWTQHSPLPWPFCPLLLILSLKCAGQDL